MPQRLGRPTNALGGAPRAQLTGVGTSPDGSREDELRLQHPRRVGGNRVAGAVTVEDGVSPSVHGSRRRTVPIHQGLLDHALDVAVRHAFVVSAGEAPLADA